MYLFVIVPRGNIGSYEITTLSPHLIGEDSNVPTGRKYEGADLQFQNGVSNHYYIESKKAWKQAQPHKTGTNLKNLQQTRNITSSLQPSVNGRNSYALLVQSNKIQCYRGCQYYNEQLSHHIKQFNSFKYFKK